MDPVTDRLPASIASLGNSIARSWERRNCDPDFFSEIATQSLTASPLLEFGIRDITCWFLQQMNLPVQRKRAFGQPCINLYKGRGFHIDALFWTDALTSIHQHAFSGAFGILHGSSLHCEFRFVQSERICRELLIGALSPARGEVLRKGAVREIHGGSRFIHAVTHLDAPTVSVVVRTDEESRYLPQYSYLHPGLAVDRFARSEPLQTQLALLSTLGKCQPRLFGEMADEIVASRDLFFAYKVIETLSTQSEMGDAFDRLIARLSARHADLAHMLVLALAEQRKQSAVALQMRAVLDPNHRLALAIGSTHLDEESANELLARAFPGSQPEALISKWVRELSEMSR